MREALGLLETRGLSNAILAADAMVKAANINVIGLENTRGLGYMTIKISGDVGAVNAAVSCGRQIAMKNNSFVSAKVIPRPSNSVEVTFCQLNKEGNVSKENTSVEKNSVGDFIKTNHVIENEQVEKEKSSEDDISITRKVENEEIPTEIEKAEVEDKVDDESANIKAEKENGKKRSIAKKEQEEIKENNEESPIDRGSTEQKVSNNEKSKVRKSTRRKAETKKKEE